jgi:hypothetical protein
MGPAAVDSSSREWEQREVASPNSQASNKFTRTFKRISEGRTGWQSLEESCGERKMPLFSSRPSVPGCWWVESRAWHPFNKPGEAPTNPTPNSSHQKQQSHGFRDINNRKTTLAICPQSSSTYTNRGELAKQARNPQHFLTPTGKQKGGGSKTKNPQNKSPNCSTQRAPTICQQNVVSLTTVQVNKQIKEGENNNASRSNTNANNKLPALNSAYSCVVHLF